MPIVWFTGGAGTLANTGRANTMVKANINIRLKTFFFFMSTPPT
jgi:hypothetical protein